MDWSVLIGLLALLIVGATASFYAYAFVVRTRKAFLDRQPNLRITNLSALNSGDVLTLTPELENVGGGVAYDCVMHLSGWEGNFSVKSVHPRGPRYQKHVIPIVLGPDAPIRVKPMTNDFLRLRYRDRWGLTYECWYHVSQLRSGSMRFHNVHIDLEHPDVTRPHLSFLEMWRLLRTDPPRD
ncbi:MAG TPA: hypothetical protein VKP13_18645 [Nitrospira sp.]|nr:hypothetical protein [Nitrospira sp.]